MKKKLSLLLLALTVPMLACADAVEINGLYYNLISKAKVAEVTQHPNLRNGYKGEITIPDNVSYGGTAYKVTWIGEKAFYDSHITSITIGDNVTNIGHLAFWNCDELISVKLGKSVETIHEQAFSNLESLTTLKLPNSVRTIEINAFMESSGLTSVELNEGLETIDISAFGGCENLESIKIPNSVKTLGRYVEEYETLMSSVFFNCKSLSSVTIGNGITTLGTQTFQGCGLESIVIPTNIDRVEDNCFIDCSKLSSVTILGDVTYIGDEAFVRCKELSDMYCYAGEVPSLGKDVFLDSYLQYATLHVPSLLIDKYKAAAQWKDFGNIVALKDGDPGFGGDPVINPPSTMGGDLTGDGVVNGTDLVLLVDYILQGNNDEEDADLNGDGQVNGTDLVVLVNLIMDAEPSNAREVMTRNNDISNTSVSIEPLHIGAGESRKMTISVSNPDMDVTMMQFDMVLPKGLRVNRIGNYMEYELTDRTSSDKHSAYIRDNGDFTRVLIASGTNAILDGTEGGVIRLTLTADDDFEGGNIEFRNMLCTSPDLHEARPHSFTAYIAGNVTDIQEINSESTGSAIYNLSGQRLKTTHKGLNIVNGKKVMVK